MRSDPTSKSWKKNTENLSLQEERIEKKMAAVMAEQGVELTSQPNQTPYPPVHACLIDFRRFAYFSPNPERPGEFQSQFHYLGLICRAEGQVKMLDLGPAEMIENTIARWRRPIEAANASRRSIDSVAQQAMDRAGKELRKLLWEPIVPHLGNAETVIISPDGALGRFPLSALPGKEPGTFLLEERRMVNFPVPALMPNVLAEPPGRVTNLTHSLLIGNIDYGLNSVQQDHDLFSYRNRRILGNLQFASLKNSALELDSIRRFFDDATSLEGTKATEKVFAEQVTEHTLLHIATHGFFQSPHRFMRNVTRGDPQSHVAFEDQAAVITENPNLLSGLAFANANDAGSHKIGEQYEDGILYSAEIALLPMDHVELAVLSACETSLGADDTPGEGLIGIQRAFQVAGANTTVASYWKVNDQATQMLMNKFYENLIEYGRKAKSEGRNDNSTTVRIDALRDAQLWMLRGLNPQQVAQLTRGPDDDTSVKDIRKTQPADPNAQPEYVSHPRYWAAFVLSGDWR